MSFIHVGVSKLKAVEDSGEMAVGLGTGTEHVFSCVEKVYFHLPASYKSNPNNTGRAKN